MDLIQIIAAKRMHVDRMAAQSGAAGELRAISATDQWSPRPKGPGLKTLLAELEATGISIKGSSFDAVASPRPVNFLDPIDVRTSLEDMIFIEIKTANQTRIKPGFGGFFFAITENEISASDQLGSRHLVALFNKISGEVQITSVPDILARSRSMTWQLSLQL